MTKHEAEATRRAMEAAGYSVTTPQQQNGSGWVVEGKRPNGVSVLISDKSGWEIEVNEQGITVQPQPGARLKRPELGATVQHSVTLPAQCWQDIEALGVNPKGKNVRSEGVFKLWQAWKEAP